MLVWLVLYGLRAEFDLRAAADSWPRLHEERKNRWKYQMDWVRTAYLPAVLAAVYIAAGLGLAFDFRAAWWYSAAAAALVLAVVYLKRVQPLYQAWHRDDPARCRAKWMTRGNEVAATGITPQSYRPDPTGSDGAEPAQREVTEQAVGGA